MLRRPLNRLLALIAGLGSLYLLTGCANEFARFYKPAPADYGQLIVAPATPQLLWSGHPDADAKQLAEAGYVLIGTSSFHGGPDPQCEKEALAQGKSVGAAIVLLKVEFGFMGSHGRHMAQVDEPATGEFFASYWGRTTPAPPGSSIRQVPGDR